MLALGLLAGHGDVLKGNEEDIVPKGHAAEFVCNFHFTFSSGRGVTDMLLEAVPGGIDGLANVSLALRGEGNDVNDASGFEGVGKAIQCGRLWGAVSHFSPLGISKVQDVLNEARKGAAALLLAFDPA